MNDPKAVLRRRLADAFDAWRWKLEGLSEYDLRRPLVPTGTNLLGLAKHVAFVSAGYLGDVFGRESAMPPYPEHEPNADLWATADESADHVLGLLDRAAAECDATIEALDLDAPGRVPWWGDQGDVTLHTIVVHLLVELNRHLGQADIVRELVDGQVGMRAGDPNLPADRAADRGAWAAHRARLQAIADTFA